MTLDRIISGGRNIALTTTAVVATMLVVSLMGILSGTLSLILFLGSIALGLYNAIRMRRFIRRVSALRFIERVMHANGVEKRRVSNGELDMIYEAGIGRTKGGAW